MITTDKTQLNINVLTQEQYEQAKADETLEDDALYMVDDDIHQMGVELDLTVDSGYTTAVSVPANSYYDYNIVFSKHFDNIPVVSASFVSTSVAGAFGNCVCGVHDVTTTGFYVRIFNGDTVSRAPSIVWSAIEYTKSYNVIPQQVDYVIEGGTNNGWDYRKYANGEFDAVRHVNPTIAYTTKTSNIYKSSDYTIQLPSFCTSFKYINGQCNGSNQWITFADITSNPPAWVVMSAESGTREVNIKFFMRGRWQ